MTSSKKPNPPPNPSTYKASPLKSKPRSNPKSPISQILNLRLNNSQHERLALTTLPISLTMLPKSPPSPILQKMSKPNPPLKQTTQMTFSKTFLFSTSNQASDHCRRLKTKNLKKTNKSSTG
jgi:hypothetical protein